MPEEPKFKRNIAYKFRIGDLLLCNIYTVSPGTGELILEYSGKIERRK